MRRRLVVSVSDSASLPQMEALFGSLPEMLDFQRVFLQTLEERIASCPDFSSLETPGQFKVGPTSGVLTGLIWFWIITDVLSLLEDAALLSGRIFSLLRRPLQALQRLLCKPHQGPESPGER